MGKIQNANQYLVTHKKWFDFVEVASKIKAQIGDREPTILEKIQLESTESVRDELREELDVYDRENPVK